MGRRARAKRLKRGRRLRRLAAVVLVSVALLSTSLAAGLLLSGLIGSDPPAGPRTAAIVDQLSLTQANPTFVERATDTLEQAGYAVDYYVGEEVTVEFYRNLPTHGYELIILRVHSTLLVEVDTTTGSATPTEYVGLFTSEPYTRTRYPDEIRARRLSAVFYYEGAPKYFGTGSGFVESSMKGKFDDTLIIMMGCEGLRAQRTARALLDRGARAFVGWSGPVSAAHTDAATERLLRHLLIDGLTIEQAVARTMAEVGPDPSYGAELRILTDGGG